jgi:hypothetical protein
LERIHTSESVGEASSVLSQVAASGAGICEVLAPLLGFCCRRRFCGRSPPMCFSLIAPPLTMTATAAAVSNANIILIPSSPSLGLRSGKPTNPLNSLETKTRHINEYRRAAWQFSHEGSTSPGRARHGCHRRCFWNGSMAESPYFFILRICSALKDRREKLFRQVLLLIIAALPGTVSAARLRS